MHKSSGIIACSLNNYRCQKEGWQKAIIHTPQRGADGFSFTVELARMIPKGPRKGERETVRFVPTGPRSQILLPTALEARHWGAVYALYRVRQSVRLSISQLYTSRSSSPIICLLIVSFLLLHETIGINWSKSTRKLKNIRNGCTTRTLLRPNERLRNVKQR